MKSRIKRLLPVPLKDGLKEFVRPRIHQRRIHAYCVGAMKTGTTSIAGLFAANYRTEHEPDKYRLIEAVLDADSGTMTRRELVRFVQRRDRRLWLEMESSGFVSFIVDILAAEFPDARFILTVRECSSWLDSAFNHLIARSVTPAETAFIRWALKPERYAFGPHERPLEEKGLFPLDCLLDFWAAHNARALDAIPKERLLVLPTTGISEGTEMLAAFLGIPAKTLDFAQSHLYRAKASLKMLDQLDKQFVADRIAERCGKVMAQLETHRAWAMSESGRGARAQQT
jgi:hypothetical protein